MSELIDREALLDECLNHYEVCNIEQNCTMDWICKTVRNFPAAAIEALQAEMPKLGEWIYKPKDAIEMMFTLPKCSVCGHESSDANNYCPNCGAKMEVQE